MKNNKVSQRKDDFFEQLNLSESTTRNYRQILTGDFLRNIIMAKFKRQDIFEMTSLEELVELYSIIILHPQNLRGHRLCSSAIMRYIKFLNGGKKYSVRKDYKNKRSKKKPSIIEEKKDSINN